MTAPPNNAIRLSPAQGQVFNSTARFRVICAGRRFGKTHLAISTLLKAALDAPGRVLWFVAPSYRQAQQIAWRILKGLMPKGNALKWNETDLSVELKNGSIIALRGADNYDSLRGVGLDGLVLDEYADMQESAWSEVLRPALSDKRGWAMFIGSPKGFNHFHALWTRAHVLDDTWQAFQFTTLDGGRVPPDEIDAARVELDPRSFRQEYEASFESMTGLVYQNFDRKVHIREDLKDNGGPLLIGLDFNVTPCSAVVGVRAGDQLHVFDEINLNNSNTQRMADEIKRRYPNRQINVYPDPSGKARKTSAGIGDTDFSILKAAGFRVIAPQSAPRVTDRINEVNALFTNAKDEHRLFISKACPKLIHCLEGLTFREETMEPDKRLGLDHALDALGYLVHSEFPLVKHYTTSQEFRI
jgi:hypothetical protein